MLAWLDIETTGLVPHKNSILEIGFIITSDDLQNEFARWAWVLPFSGEVDEFIAKMHGPAASGGSDLLAECAVMTGLREGWKSPRQIAGEIHDWLKTYLPEGEKPPLCGLSVDFDRGFLRANLDFLPLFDFFHYRVIDVSTVKEMARRWAPSVYESRPKPGAKHRALSDLDDTIAEAKHYKTHLFGPGQFMAVVG